MEKPTVTTGRPDEVIRTAAEEVCKSRIEPMLNGFPVWECGLGALVNQAVEAVGVRKQPFEVPLALVNWMKGK